MSKLDSVALILRIFLFECLDVNDPCIDWVMIISGQHRLGRARHQAGGDNQTSSQHKLGFRIITRVKDQMCSQFVNPRVFPIEFLRAAVCVCW